MDDLITLATLVASAFFAAVGAGLLFRYRQLSGQVNQSAQLAADLWSALETRLRKQDERVLDVMTRLEVVQTRILSKSELGPAVPMQSQPSSAPSVSEVTSPKTANVASLEDVEPPEISTESTSRTEKPSDLVSSQSPSQAMSQVTSQESAGAAAADSVGVSPQSTTPSMDQVIEDRLAKQDEMLSQIMSKLDSLNVGRAITHQTASRLTTGPAARSANVKISEKALFDLFKQGPVSSRDLKEPFDVTREHANRVLEKMFDRGLVTRNSDHKPFVYELTEEGRKAAEKA